MTQFTERQKRMGQAMKTKSDTKLEPWLDQLCLCLTEGLFRDPIRHNLKLKYLLECNTQVQ